MSLIARGCFLRSSILIAGLFGFWALFAWTGGGCGGRSLVGPRLGSASAPVYTNNLGKKEEIKAWQTRGAEDLSNGIGRQNGNLAHVEAMELGKPPRVGLVGGEGWMVHDNPLNFRKRHRCCLFIYLNRTDDFSIWLQGYLLDGTSYFSVWLDE